jgi:hypothetical protein
VFPTEGSLRVHSRATAVHAAWRILWSCIHRSGVLGEAERAAGAGGLKNDKLAGRPRRRHIGRRPSSGIAPSVALGSGEDVNRRQLLARAAALSAALAADPFMSTRGHPTGRTIEAKEAALSAASSLESELDTSTAHLGTWGGLLPTAAIAAAQQGDGREGSAAGAARRSRGTPAVPGGAADALPDRRCPRPCPPDRRLGRDGDSARGRTAGVRSWRPTGRTPSATVTTGAVLTIVQARGQFRVG